MKCPEKSSLKPILFRLYSTPRPGIRRKRSRLKQGARRRAHAFEAVPQESSRRRRSRDRGGPREPRVVRETPGPSRRKAAVHLQREHHGVRLSDRACRRSGCSSPEPADGPVAARIRAVLPGCSAGMRRPPEAELGGSPVRSQQRLHIPLDIVRIDVRPLRRPTAPARASRWRRRPACGLPTPCRRLELRARARTAERRAADGRRFCRAALMSPGHSDAASPPCRWRSDCQSAPA